LGLIYATLGTYQQAKTIKNNLKLLNEIKGKNEKTL
jgi:hypothetical protein